MTALHFEILRYAQKVGNWKVIFNVDSLSGSEGSRPVPDAFTFFRKPATVRLRGTRWKRDQVIWFD